MKTDRLSHPHPLWRGRMSWFALSWLLVALCASLARAEWNLLERDLFAAIEKGDTREVSRLIDRGADVNGRHPVTGKTPLSLAMEKPKPDVIALLMAAGAEEKGMTDLEEAARQAQDAMKNQSRKTPVSQEGWTLRLAEMKADTAPPAGRLLGRPFTPDRVVFKDGVLRLAQQGQGVLPELEMVIHFVLQKGDSLSGKQYRIAPDSKVAPRVEVNWKKAGQSLPETRSYANGYAMLLQFERVKEDGVLPGTLHLSLPDEQKSYVRGSFATSYGQAMTAQALSSQRPPEPEPVPTEGMSEEEREALMAVLQQAGLQVEQGEKPEGGKKRAKVTVPAPLDPQLFGGFLKMQQEEESPMAKLLGLLWTLASVVGWWKIFTKARQPGWASLIPIYNFWVMLRMAGRPGWHLVLLLVPFVNFYIIIATLHGISRNFGQNALFTVGLVFLHPVFSLILGFGDAQYADPEAREEAARFVAHMAGAEFVARNRQNAVQREE